MFSGLLKPSTTPEWPLEPLSIKEQKIESMQVSEWAKPGKTVANWAKEKRGLTIGFQISITTMQLARCNIVPWACSQVELFGTGCVGCVITAKVIIDQGIYNVTLFTCLWKSAWKPGTAGRKTGKNSCVVVNNGKPCHWLICHTTEAYITPLIKEPWNARIEMWNGSTCRLGVHHKSHVALLYHRIKQRFLQDSLWVTNYSLKWKCSYSLMKLSAQIKHKSHSVFFLPPQSLLSVGARLLCAQQAC